MRRDRKKKIRTGFAGFLAGLFFVLSGTGFRLQAAAAVMESNAPGDVAVTGTAAEEENVSIPELSLNSQSAVLMDAKTGRILYGKEADMIRTALEETLKNPATRTADVNGTASTTEFTEALIGNLKK